MRHASLALLTALTCGIAKTVEHDKPWNLTLTDGLGYAALSFIGVTLLVGPFRQLSGRYHGGTPVNVDLRRDVGIWAGFTGIAHTVLGFGAHFGGDIGRYLFPGSSPLEGWLPFGVSNWVGVVATLVLFVLLVLSNDIALRALGGPSWKRIQRWNYALGLLVLLHTLGYQLVLRRSLVLFGFSAGLAVAVVLMQLRGRAHFRASLANRERMG